MARCWCGKDHDCLAERGDARNGPIRHGVINWKLYELRMIDRGLTPFPEVNPVTQEQTELVTV